MLKRAPAECASAKSQIKSLSQPIFIKSVCMTRRLHSERTLMTRCSLEEVVMHKPGVVHIFLTELKTKIMCAKPLGN